jgi:hypothetical protein
MKQIKTSRFSKKRPEEISFQGAAILEKPKAANRSKTAKKLQKSKSERTNVRTNIRTNIRSTDRTAIREAFHCRIEVPEPRRKIRHSFDIFEDQKSALEKLQLAIANEEGSKPSLGDMVQEALDLYTRQKTKKLSNVELISHN